MEKIDQTEFVRQLADIGGLLPDLFAVFDSEQFSMVHINPAGKKLLDPSGKTKCDNLVLTEIVGVNEIDRFRRDIYPQARVLGSWAGHLVMRDVAGSEFICWVKLLDAAGNSKHGGRVLYLYATRAAQEAHAENFVSDSDMLNAMLETVPDCVYFKDSASRFLRIGSAQAAKLGIKTARDAIGKTDFDFFTPEHATPAFEDEQSIIKTSQPIVDKEEKETFPDGSFAWVSTTKLPFYNREGKLIGTYGISRDITAHKKAEEAIRRSEAILRSTFAAAPVGIALVQDRVACKTNDLFCEITGRLPEELLGQSSKALYADDAEYKRVGHALYDNLRERGRASVETVWMHKDGKKVDVLMSAAPLEIGEMHEWRIITALDLTDKKRTEQERREMETRLQLASKLESVGSLAAGVAHEVNTPTQFISDNVRFLTDSFRQLSLVLGAYRAQLTEIPAEKSAALEALEKGNEIDYLLAEIPRCLEQSMDGLRRIGKIVGSLKEFSHPSGEEKSNANINRAIETTVAVSRHEWKYVADLVTELDPGLPKVHCVIDEINQAILNLIINASHAIEDANKLTGVIKGLITIRTRQDAGDVIIEVQDTGTGIPEHARERVFEPFFTTKSVGRGTGQGLAIVQAIVVKKHHGSVSFTTEMGKGTTFRLSLPLTPPPPGSTIQIFAANK